MQTRTPCHSSLFLPREQANANPRKLNTRRRAEMPACVRSLRTRDERAQVLIRSGEVKSAVGNYGNGGGAVEKAPAADRYRPQQRSVALIERVPLSTLRRCIDHALCDHWSP